jgi:hypothetical protein
MARPVAPAVAPAVGCTPEARNGLSVTVRTGDGKRVCEALVTVTDGQYKETLERRDAEASTIPERSECVYSGLEERPGDYRVLVAAPGFRPAELDHVVVVRDACHVIPRSVTVVVASM